MVFSDIRPGRVRCWNIWNLLTILNVNLIIILSLYNCSRHFLAYLLINWMKTRYRDSIRSRIFQILKVIRVFCCFFKEDPRIRGISWFFLKFKENTDFLWIFLKNRDFSRILTYVNFSLSAKFNRFFIILGGIEEKDQKLWFFKKPTKNVVFRGFSWFFENTHNYWILKIFKIG